MSPGISPNPLGGFARLAHDIVTLIDLQFQLVLIDCKESYRRAVTSVLLIAAAFALAIGAIPLALGSAALVLVAAAGWTLTSALAITAGISFLLSASLLIACYVAARGVATVFRRSGQEFQKNMNSIKSTLQGGEDQE